MITWKVFKIAKNADTVLNFNYLAIKVPDFKPVDKKLPELEHRVSRNFDIKIVSRKKLLKVLASSKPISGEIFLFQNLVLYMIYLAFPCRERGTATGFPNYSRPFVVEEVTVHNTGISLFLSTSVWVLLSPPIESRETRPTA